MRCRGGRPGPSSTSSRAASRGSIGRWEGMLFLFYYVAYTIYVVLAAQQHDALTTYTTAMSTFVIPLTAVTLLILGWQALRANRGR